MSDSIENHERDKKTKSNDRRTNNSMMDSQRKKSVIDHNKNCLEDNILNTEKVKDMPEHKTFCISV